MLPRAFLVRPLVLLPAVLITLLMVLASSFAADGATDVTARWAPGPSFPSAFESRWDAAIAYHPPTGKVYLFGGSPARAGEAWRNDTWKTNGSASWTAGPSAPAGLTPRGGSAIAYYPPTGDLVLFSGGGDEWPYPNDTWLFDGSTWRPGPAAPAGMKGRIGARMAYDPGSQKLVMHGGAGEEPFTDTWLFNGTKWVAGPSPHPDMPPRAYFGMTYDARVGKILINGGSGDQSSFYFNGSRWVNAPNLPNAVGPRERYDLEYHPGLGRSVFFGGIGPRIGNHDLWVFDRGGVWNEATPSSGSQVPDDRFDADLVWVDHLNTMLLVGGVHHRGNGEDIYRETWTLTVENA